MIWSFRAWGILAPLLCLLHELASLSECPGRKQSYLGGSMRRKPHLENMKRTTKPLKLLRSGFPQPTETCEILKTLRWKSEHQLTFAYGKQSRINLILKHGRLRYLRILTKCGQTTWSWMIPSHFDSFEVHFLTSNPIKLGPPAFCSFGSEVQLPQDLAGQADPTSGFSVSFPVRKGFVFSSKLSGQHNCPFQRENFFIPAEKQYNLCDEEHMSGMGPVHANDFLAARTIDSQIPSFDEPVMRRGDNWRDSQ